MSTLDSTPWWRHEYRTVLFYRYVFIEDPIRLKKDLELLTSSLKMIGRVLISKEGLNGTLAAPNAIMEEFVDKMKRDTRFARIDWKFNDIVPNPTSLQPFPNLNIRCVDQIISIGLPNVEIPTVFDETTFGGLASDITGKHLLPKEFHERLCKARTDEDKNVVIIDVRNNFETKIGRFEGSVPIDTTTYAESWKNLDRIIGLQTDAYKLPNGKARRLQARLERRARRDIMNSNTQAESSNSSCGTIVPDVDKNASDQAISIENKVVYMYCTGGIRCEKASSYLISRGVKNVFQLQGGVHRYLEEFGSDPESLFKGKNYVFDSSGSCCVDVDPTSEPCAPAANDLRTSAASGLQDHSTKPISQCLVCSIPYDTYNGYTTCCVCRTPVLICMTCAVNSRHPGQFHCEKHAYLQECYFAALDIYTKEELLRQKELLQQLYDSAIKQPRVKTTVLVRQMHRIDGQLHKRAEGVNPVPQTQNPQVAFWVKARRDQVAETQTTSTVHAG